MANTNNSNTDLKAQQMENILTTVTDYSDKALEKSRETVDRSVKVAKKYPIHTAIGLGVLGFIAGAITSKVSK